MNGYALSAMRRHALRSMDATAEIQVQQWNGAVESFLTVAEHPCCFTPGSREGTQGALEPLGRTALWNVDLPANAEVSRGNRIIVRGATRGIPWSKVVRAIHDAHARTFEVFRRVECEEAASLVFPTPCRLYSYTETMIRRERRKAWGKVTDTYCQIETHAARFVDEEDGEQTVETLKVNLPLGCGAEDQQALLVLGKAYTLVGVHTVPDRWGSPGHITATLETLDEVLP